MNERTKRVGLTDVRKTQAIMAGLLNLFSAFRSRFMKGNAAIVSLLRPSKLPVQLFLSFGAQRFRGEKRGVYAQSRLTYDGGTFCCGGRHREILKPIRSKAV
jgi:hypothetical protein